MTNAPLAPTAEASGRGASRGVPPRLLARPRDVGPYLGVTLIFSLPAIPYLAPPLLATTSLLALAAGLGAATALDRGARRGTEFALAGFAAGTILKAVSLAVAGFIAWQGGGNIVAALLLNLGLLLLLSGWTYVRLAVSSGAGFTK